MVVALFTCRIVLVGPIIPAMLNRRPMLFSAASAVAVGSFGLFHLMGSPRFTTYHTVDVVQLLASGACFGVALTTVFVYFGIGRFAASQSKAN
jgi:hypothetical protein